MKTLIFILLSVFALTTLAHNGHSHDPPSTHGMLMTGNSKIYLSHLPMFHSPHDYQVIFEAEIDAESKAAYESHLKSSNETVYTLVPETFVLPDMVKAPKTFSAQIYKGHFERGGELIADNVQVNVKVLYFKKFDPKAMQPDLATYILFGNANEMFLAHVITAKPDHDQIVKVTPTTELQALLGHNTFALLEAKAQSNTTPLNEGDNVQMVSDHVDLNVAVESTIYLETGDLSF